jgi:hypothetical protein
MMTRKEQAVEWLKLHPEAKAQEFITILGMSEKSFYNYKKELQVIQVDMKTSTRSNTVAISPIVQRDNAIQMTVNVSQSQHTVNAVDVLNTVSNTDTVLNTVSNTVPILPLTASNTVSVSGTVGQKNTVVVVAVVTALASMINMYSVTVQLSENSIVAVLFTALFSFGGLAFLASGERGALITGLCIALIFWEVFCNAVNIYSGLYDIDKECAGKFLHRVCHFAGTEATATAKWIAGSVSMLAGTVLYTAMHKMVTR